MRCGSGIRTVTTRKGCEHLCKHVDKLNVGMNACPLVDANRMPEFFEVKSGSVVFGWSRTKWHDVEREPSHSTSNIVRAPKKTSALPFVPAYSWLFIFAIMLRHSLNGLRRGALLDEPLFGDSRDVDSSPFEPQSQEGMVHVGHTGSHYCYVAALVV